MQMPGLALSPRVLFDSEGMLETGDRRQYSTAVQDCKGLTNQAIKGEVIMSSFSRAGSKRSCYISYSL